MLTKVKSIPTQESLISSGMPGTDLGDFPFIPHCHFVNQEALPKAFNSLHFIGSAYKRQEAACFQNVLRINHNTFLYSITRFSEGDATNSKVLL